MKANIKLPLMYQCKCSNGNEAEKYIGKEPESIFIALYFFLFYSVCFLVCFRKGMFLSQMGKN